MNPAQTVYGEFMHVAVKPVDRPLKLMSVEKLHYRTWLNATVPKEGRTVVRMEGLDVDIIYSSTIEGQINKSVELLLNKQITGQTPMIPYGSVVFRGFDHRSIGNLEFDTLDTKLGELKNLII